MKRARSSRPLVRRNNGFRTHRTRFYPVVAAAARCGERLDRVGLQSELDGTLREVERSRPKVVVDVSRIATSLLAGPRTNVQFFEALQKRLVAQGLRTVSFFMPVPAAAAGYA